MAKPKKVLPLVDPDSQFNSPGVEDVESPAEVIEEKDKMCRINIGVEIKINKKIFAPGIHTVPRHVADTISEMVNKKRNADRSIFIGKNKMVERMLDRTLVIHEVEDVQASITSRATR